MRNRTFLAACAVALGAVGALSAPTAAAQDAGFSDYPCSEQFAVPWSLDAWNGTHNVVFSPYGTADIRCASFHGQTSAYQVDPQGRRHTLNRFFTNLYFWDPS